MSSFTMLLVLIMIALAAIIGDHYSRLQKMGWAPQPEEYKKGRSLLDPIGSLFGEIGRADAPYKVAAMVFGPIGKVTEMAYAPLGAGLNLAGKTSEFIYKPISMVLGLVAFAKKD